MASVVPSDVRPFTTDWHNKPYPAIAPSLPALSAVHRNVIITGSDEDIGAAVAVAFAQAGAASVSIIGRDTDRLQSSSASITAARRYPDTRVWYEVADLTERGEVDRAFSNIVSRVGPLHVLVLSTGSPSHSSPLLTTPVSVFLDEFADSILSPLKVVQAFVGCTGPEATLINISSRLAHIAPVAGMGAFASSKAANLKLMDHLAVENPGLHVVSMDASYLSPTTNAGQEFGAPNNVILPGHFAVWLASPEARFLRGKYVWMNWDVQQLKERAAEIRGSRLLTCFLDGVAM